MTRVGRVVLAVLLVALVATSSAAASSRVYLIYDRDQVVPSEHFVAQPPESRPYQAWLDASLEPTPATNIRIFEMPCEGQTTHPEVFAIACVSPSVAMTPPVPPAVSDVVFDAGFGPIGHEAFLHEVGHIWETLTLQPDSRRALLHTLRPVRIVESPARRNWAEDPAERIAGAYASCSMRRQPPAPQRKRGLVRVWGGSWTYTLRDWRRACSLIRLSA